MWMVKHHLKCVLNSGTVTAYTLQSTQKGDSPADWNRNRDSTKATMEICQLSDVISTRRLSCLGDLLRTRIYRWPSVF